MGGSIVGGDMITSSCGVLSRAKVSEGMTVKMMIMMMSHMGAAGRWSPGVVYQLHNGELKELEGGMSRYEELAKRLLLNLPYSYINILCRAQFDFTSSYEQRRLPLLKT
jgi:hypothetical protein